MKTKIIFRFIPAFVLIFLFGITFNMALGHTLSEEEAFMMIYGNYDRIHKNSIWENMKFPNKEDADGFFEKKTGIVSSFLFQSFKESGEKKFFLLTKTIPVGIPFDCHACLPLLSATVFALAKDEWKIESQNLFLMYQGEYGELPIVKLITIGNDKVGLSLEYEHHGEVHTKEMAFLIPYKKSIENAHQETIYYDNSGECGQSVQCASYGAKISFNNSRTNSFYDLKIKKFGTKYDESRAYKIVRVDEELLFHFVNGKYIQVARRGALK